MKVHQYHNLSISVFKKDEIKVFRNRMIHNVFNAKQVSTKRLDDNDKHFLANYISHEIINSGILSISCSNLGSGKYKYYLSANIAGSELAKDTQNELCKKIATLEQELQLFKTMNIFSFLKQKIINRKNK